MAVTCPAGNSCDADGTIQQQCSMGTYSLEDEGVCKACPAGSQCADTTSAPVACLDGWYSLASAITCIQCPEGYFCASKSVEPVRCPGTSDEQYSDAGWTACQKCPAGFYCTSFIKQACSDGQYSALGDNTCQTCRAGYKCPTKDGTEIACSSPSTYQILQQQTTCDPCPAGSECPSASGISIPCTTGTYSLAGDGVCSSCPVGYKCPVTDQAPIACTQLKQYQTLEGKTECLPCPAGSECPTTSAAPIPCTEGTYSLAGDGVCTACPAGSKCPVSGEAPVTCTQFKEYQDQTGQTQCIPCPAGSECSTVSATPSSCKAGTYSQAGYGVCTACLQGTYSDLGAGVCSPCPKGFKCQDPSKPPQVCTALKEYQDKEGQETCKKCPAGSSCLTAQDAPEACPVGTFSQESEGQCTDCPAGFKCPSTSQASTPCDTPKEYQDMTGQTVCKSCPKNFECPVVDGAPKACPSGNYANAGSGVCCLKGKICASTSQSCPQGQFSSDSICKPCPAGYRCPGSGGHAILCSGSTAEQFSYEGQSSCSTCPAGFECPSIYDRPKLCEFGFYSRQGDGYCSVCPLGYACTSPIFAPTPCATGTYAREGSTFCSKCPLGSSCANPEMPPQSCANGTYSSTDGTTCIACEIKKFCPSVLAFESYPCPGGFYSVGNQIACTACPAGHYCVADSQSPVPCQTGYFSFGSAIACTACPPGYYCPDPSKEPVLCSKGKYSLAGAFECSECPEGKSCLIMNAIDVPANNPTCASGQYRIIDGRTTICRDCPVGHSCATPNALPVACPAGSFALAKQASCTECPIGYYCPSPGADKLLCPPGTYQIETGKTYCNACPVGSTCASALVAPIPCVAGTYAPVGNLTSCYSCPEGFACPSNSLTREPFLCPNGTYSPAGSDRCIRCEAGYACPDTRASSRVECSQAAGDFSQEGSTHCTPCPFGRSCSQTTDTAVYSQCASGFYSDEGIKTCTACPAGKSCNTKGLLEIVDCSPGLYSLEGDQTCRPCPAGFMCPNIDGTGILECSTGQYAPQASIKCFNCPPGFFCPYKNQAVVERCPPGTYSLGNHTTCFECPVHYQCPHRDSLVYLTDGFFSPHGTSLPFRCRAGWECRHDPVTKVSVVRPCELGYYSLTGSASCNPCPEGHYCPLQDHQPIKCPEGYYNDKTLQTKCTQICPRGKYRVVRDTVVCEQIREGEEYLFSFGRPVACPAGSYSNSAIAANENLIGCQKCNAGVLCLGGETSPASAGTFVCPNGYWCNHVDERNSIFGMWACPAGFYAQTAVTGAKSRDSACTKCEAGYYCEGADRPKSQCEPGYFCPDIQTERATQFPCPAGTYNPSYGSIDRTQDCLVCPSGSYCPEGSASPLPCMPGNMCPISGMKDYQQMPCPGGTFQKLKGQLACSTCPAGEYCPMGSVQPMLCPPGTYNDLTGQEFQTDCKPCPPNYLCSVFGLVDYQNQGQPALEWGHLSPKVSKYGQELTCPPGSYDDQASRLTSPSQCTVCPAGQACPPGASIDGNPIMRVRCEVGHYCPSGTMHDRHFPCPGGTWSNADNLVSASQCTDCPEGYFCPPGTYRPFICPNGYYCPLKTENYQHYPCPFGSYHFLRGLSASTQCLICPTGFFCQDNQVLFPKKCPIGTYSDATGATQPDNTIEKVSVVCKICPAGSECHLDGMSAQIGCPKGTYSPVGSNQCFPCKPGFDCSLAIAGAMTMAQYRVSPCPQGYFCSGGDRRPCSPGYFCPTGSMREIPCPVGKVLLTSGNDDISDCVSVDAGLYVALRGQNTSDLNSLWVSETEYTHDIGFLCYLGYSCPTGSHHQFMYRCPRGTYQDQFGQSTCKNCPEGYYCNENSILPILCPQGHYCPLSTYSPIKCKSGTFGAQLGLKAESECQKCSGGQYCSQKGLSAPDGLCDPGFYCIAGAQVPNPKDKITGDVCMIGGFCDAGSRNFTSCPPGTFRNSTQGKTQQDCQACTPGYYCSGDSLGTPSGKCEAGYYCPVKSTVSKQIPADPGYYTLEGNETQTECPVGTYNPFTAQGSCTKCRPGFYCDEEGMSDKINNCLMGHYCPEGSNKSTKCPAGTYNNQLNAKALSDCKDCLPGKYCDSDGLVDPTGDCDQGYFCTKQAIQNDPGTLDAQERFGPCPKGYYCPTATWKPLPCPAGTYSEEEKLFAKEQCQPCTAGYYCPSAGMTAPLAQCDEGFYCPQGSVTARPPDYYCKAGQMCPKGSSSPQNCKEGNYQSMPFQSACVTCPDGYFCLEGATQYALSKCPKGYKCPAGTKYAAQYPCSPGQYQPYEAQTECIDCDPGKYCDKQALTTPAGDCSSGYYCRVGSATNKPVGTTINGGMCDKGQYCPAGSPFPLDCPPGKFCSTPGLAIPSGPCQEGFYCISKATRSDPKDAAVDGGTLCIPGHYCPTGSSAPLPCPPGTFNQLVKQISEAACIKCTGGMYCEGSGLPNPTGICQAGYYCPEGSKSPRTFVCPIGTYCPQQSAASLPCVNKYQDLRGQLSCKECPAGFKCTTTSIELCGTQRYCKVGAMVPTDCPAGTFTLLYNASSLADCKACPKGWYCKSDATSAIIMTRCPSGVLCEGGAQTEAGTSKCPIGSYCPAASSKAIPCPPGKYCPIEGLKSLSESINCDAGYWCMIGSKIANPKDGIMGVECPAGKYCPSGTVTPVGCPIGTYNPNTAGIALANCLTCKEGYTCAKRGLSDYTGRCPAGFFCLDLTKPELQTPCSAGYFCPEGSQNQKKCAEGFYQPNMQMDSCYECPKGFYCSQIDTTFAIVCPAGSYCPARTLTPKQCPIGTFSVALGLTLELECQPCTEGKYCETPGLTQPTGKCAPGYFCKLGAVTPMPILASQGGKCIKGYYCPEGSPIMKKCPVGTYGEVTGASSATDCLPCKEGKYCNQKGKLEVDFSSNNCADGFLCKAGSKSPLPSLQPGQTGELCPAGSYCDRSGKNLCPLGTYQPNLGSSLCLQCPAGKICDTLGISVPTPCPAGSYCPQTDSSKVGEVKQSCPAGTYSPFLGLKVAEDCIPCREGKFCNVGETSATQPCKEGYYCSLGQSTSTPSGVYELGKDIGGGLCPAGHYCPEGTIAPVPCEVGTYQSMTGKSTCVKCPPGKYCDEMGIDQEILKLKDCKAGYVCLGSALVPYPEDGTTGKKCDPGYYCPAGTTKMMSCDPGRFESRIGSSECQICPSGYFCKGAAAENGPGTTSPEECPEGSFCPAESSEPTKCPDGRVGAGKRLTSATECPMCPPGKYCQKGLVAGDCTAGYYCNSGAILPNEDSKVCPIGHYCPIGTLYPIICGEGLTTSSTRKASVQDCIPCPEGYYCLKHTTVSFVCPKGYYCPKGKSPIQCPTSTYNSQRGKTKLSDCLDCPAGYFCNATGIANYKSYPCPQGYYCPQKYMSAPFECPAGTYNSKTGVGKLADCLPCTVGYYCPTASVYPIPCRNGTFCPQGATSPAPCKAGYYCPSLIGALQGCPGAFFCSIPQSDQYQKCKNGTYCPSNSTRETKCPSGSFGASNPRNIEMNDGCVTCDAGYYSDATSNNCLKCAPGYICLGNTTSMMPKDRFKENGYICPKGFYCPEGSFSPKPCPKGTYSSKEGIIDLGQCQSCPLGTYGDQVALQACKRCGGSSRALTGSDSCQCSGLHRIYLKDTQACVCKPGFISSDVNEDSNKDSLVDCQERIYERCTDNQEQDLYGRCRNKTDCFAQCGGPGRIQGGLGVCQCDNAQNLDDICNDQCRANAQRVTFTADGKLQIYDPVTKISRNVSMSEGTLGELKCGQADQSKCKLVSVGKDSSTGDFTAKYSLPTSITGKSRRLLETETRYLQATANQGGTVINNPIICLPQGSALMFENLSAKNYPVYQKDSLINTNPSFDFSKFLLLATTLKKNGTKINSFIFTFDDPGVYVFADSNATAKLTIVSVMQPSQQCPANTVYASITQANLLKVGISKNKNIVYSPDWGFFIGAVLAFLALIVLSIFVLGYVYRKSWKTARSDERVGYQHAHYEAVLKNEQLDDPDVILSINADAQSFYVLNQGKDLVRTKEQMREKAAKEAEERERKRREREQAKEKLEIEQVEDLKDKLNKHMEEIRRLFGYEASGGQDDQEDDPDDIEDDKLAEHRLLDQIIKIKMIIKENRRALEGEELDEVAAEKEKEELERTERERRELDKKLREQQDRLQRDDAYDKSQDAKTKKQQDVLLEKKDAILASLESDADKKKREMLQRLRQIGGAPMSKEDQERYLEQMDANLGKIEEVIQRDEQDQDDILRRKLEERKNRRRKLQDKVAEQEKSVEDKKKGFEERKLEVESKFIDDLAAMEGELAKEKKDRQDGLEEDLDKIKRDKLEAFEDHLRDAQNTKEFGRVLDDFQKASKRVDDELEKERLKQENDLEKILKNRRGQKRTQIEKEKMEALKSLQKDFEDKTEQERKNLDDLKGILKNEEAASNQGGFNSSAGFSGGGQQTILNPVIVQGLEKLRQMTSASTEAEESIKNSLGQSKLDLRKRLSEGLLSAVEKKMHQHTTESEEMDRRIKKEGKEADEQVEKVKAEIKAKVKEREHLKRQIEEHSGEEETKERLLKELDKTQADILQMMGYDHDQQDTLLNKRLAERRARKAKLGEQQREMKTRHQEEMALETEIAKTAAENEHKRVRDRQALEQVIIEMKDNLPREELAFAIQRAIDQKQEAELNDMLSKLFEQKCKELQDEIFHLIEERLHMQGVILKESKDSLELLIDLEDNAKGDSDADKLVREKLQEAKERIKAKEQKALADLEMQTKMKECEVERRLADRMFNIEAQRVTWLKEEQLKEKIEILDKYLPMDSIIRDCAMESQLEEAREIEEFKREQEIERQRKLEDIQKHHLALEKELKEQRDRLERVEEENKRLLDEEQRREKQVVRRVQRAEAAGRATEQISRLKKELEKVNEQLDSALSQEKARQLEMMQAALQKRVAEIERMEKEEEEKARKEEEEDRKRMEEEARKAKEVQERLGEVRKLIAKEQRYADKKRYMGGKIEPRTEYYQLLMRKRETQLLGKMEKSKISKAITMQTQVGFVELEGQSKAVSKEDQLKLLTDILKKIETLEGKVKHQVSQQRQMLGLAGSQMNRDSQSQYQHMLETSSAHRSTNSFMTGSHFGFK